MGRMKEQLYRTSGEEAYDMAGCPQTQITLWTRFKQWWRSL